MVNETKEQQAARLQAWGDEGYLVVPSPEDRAALAAGAAALRADPAPTDVIEDLVVALRALAYAAMTSGGTKGPDAALKDAIRWATDALQKYDKPRAAPAPEGLVRRLQSIAAKWREEGNGLAVRGYFQQGNRMHDCAGELEAALAALSTSPQETPAREQNRATVSRLLDWLAHPVSAATDGDRAAIQWLLDAEQRQYVALSPSPQPEGWQDIVRSVASGTILDDGCCVWCARRSSHRSDCLVTKARAVMAALTPPAEKE